MAIFFRNRGQIKHFIKAICVSYMLSSKSYSIWLNKIWKIVSKFGSFAYIMDDF